MVKTPKEYDTATTITTDEASLSQSEGRDLLTISSIIEYIERPTLKNIQETDLGTSRKWSQRETEHFYSMLKAVGTDFSIMASLQSRRTKKELLNKYKKELKMNSSKVNSILRNLHSSPLYLKVHLVQPYEPWDGQLEVRWRVWPKIWW